ncbi:MAG: MBL fold metallo-hydrolase [Candidatus Saccharibacteria bacterium]|nr:MBL fold metallo-hydrolase [Candidatus Saccharibacteria bacterium]MCA9336642.1 MBL fold metallo-hydrolase [Candidatus Saccharibacteria bacterium]MCA9340534.1 MBL fold metallo-hydrolase [Candidatus Saccharibacteria bacterium]HPQ82304.1 MBL fold metallo-hydrolase [Candidatus Saccharimonas sp.]
MFEIEYKGGNGIVVSSKKAVLNIDPKLSLVGLKDIKTKDEVELATEVRFRVENSDARIIIDSPGEYEVGDFTIRGVAATRHIDTAEQEKLSTIYRVECSDVKIAVIGNVAPVLDEEQLEAIGMVDILVLPVGGGGYTLDATSAVAIVRQVEPKVVIPVHYADSGLRYEVPQDTLEVFTQELSVPVESITKYKLKSSAGLPSTMTVVEVARS